MSLRPEVMREHARSFSLHQYFETTPARAPAIQPRVQAGVAATAAAPRPAPTGLNFTISSQTLGTRGALTTGLPATSMKTAAPMPPLSFNLASARGHGNGMTTLAMSAGQTDSQRKIPAGYVHGGNDNSAEIMRLTALLEDARAKIDRAHTKLTASETSVCRANNALVSERATANARLGQLTTEVKMLREAQAKLQTELAQTPTATKAIHDEERFRIAAEGALKVEEDNERLRKVLEETETAASDSDGRLSKLRIEYDALQASYEQVTNEFGTVVAAHEAAIDALREEMRVAANDATVSGGNDAANINQASAATAVQEAADRRLASELAAMEHSSKAAMGHAIEAAVEEATATVKAEMQLQMEAKLEATEKRAAVAEKQLFSDLEAANCARKQAETAAAKHEARAKLAEEFVAMAAPERKADAPVSATKAEPLEQMADTAEAPAANQAVEKFAAMQQELDDALGRLRSKKHCVRTQMRVSALAKRCKMASDMMLFGVSDMNNRATADEDTGVQCCSQRNNAPSSTGMQTKSYANCAVPFAMEDMGGHTLDRIEINTSATPTPSSGLMRSSTGDMMTTQQRVESLIGATKGDLTRALQYQTFLHKISAGHIEMLPTTANATKCGVSGMPVLSERESDESPTPDAAAPVAEVDDLIDLSGEH